jgi:glycine cleavage system aminomethyltransferase T
MAKSSPFEAVHGHLGANFSEYDGWRLASDYGDLEAENKALQEASAAFDLSSFGRITIKGAHSEAVIGKVLSSDVKRCDDGKWIWAVVSDSQSESADILRVGKASGAYIIFTLPAKRQRVMTLAQACADEHGLGGLKITDITEKTAMLGIYGPEAVKTVANILPFDIAGIATGDITNISFFMVSVTILRGGWLATDGLELLCPASVAPMTARVFTKYRERANITPAGMDCLKRAMAQTHKPFDLSEPRVKHGAK